MTLENVRPEVSFCLTYLTEKNPERDCFTSVKVSHDWRSEIKIIRPGRQSHDAFLVFLFQATGCMAIGLTFETIIFT